MIEPAGKFLKYVYCLTLAAMIIAALLFAGFGIYHESIGQDFGLGSIATGFAAVYGLGYRIKMIRTSPATLDVFVASGGISLARGLGMVLMTIGLFAFVLIPLSRPIASLICPRYQDLEVYTVLVGGVFSVMTFFGWIGLALFEASRHAGLKAKRRMGAAPG